MNDSNKASDSNNTSIIIGTVLLGGLFYYVTRDKSGSRSLISKEDLVILALEKRDKGELLSDEELELLEKNKEIVDNLLNSKPIRTFDPDRLKGIKVFEGTLAYDGMKPMSASLVKVIHEIKTYSTVEASDVNEVNRQILDNKVASAFVGGSDLFVRTAGNIVSVDYCRIQKVADFSGGIAPIGESIYYEFPDPTISDQITILSNKPILIKYVFKIDGLNVMAAGETVGEDKSLYGFTVHTSVGKGILLSDTLQEIKVKAGKKYKFFGPTKYKITKRVRFKSQIVDAVMAGFIIIPTLENHLIQGGVFNG